MLHAVRTESTQDLPVIEVEQLSWACPQKLVLADVSFSVQAGQFVGLLGPNGAGKSTLLRCLYRYLQPTTGGIRLNGQPLSQLSQQQLAQRVAVVTQHTPLGFSMSVRQFMATGLLAQQRFWHRRNERAERIQIDATLVRVGLLELAEQRYEHLSGGEQQRLLIARALLQRPQILILDEPTNHLDVYYQIEILQLVRSLGITVIASIHDLNLAAGYCDRLLLLQQGRLVAKGTPQQVLTSDNLQRIYHVDAIVDQHPTQRYQRVTFQYHPKPNRDANG
ncbi:ABC transporter ATP-binding protein [Ferrimonas lipolytica]|uniref:ABC transporter ATP-binding protein n=1 Tax=Ferrimonas lipolytica TaxID=2724191 RepID=A0A6H1UDT1_9GAMM|nr:ABC transporter ATP-binding protein [Ferrimonas lipolytica]QIZ76493.1 ABC transporter ATP-binding protein [Ferrimonas lipolytica]